MKKVILLIVLVAVTLSIGAATKKKKTHRTKERTEKIVRSIYDFSLGMSSNEFVQMLKNKNMNGLSGKEYDLTNLKDDQIYLFNTNEKIGGISWFAMGFKFKDNEIINITLMCKESRVYAELGETLLLKYPSFFVEEMSDPYSCVFFDDGDTELSVNKTLEGSVMIMYTDKLYLKTKRLESILEKSIF